MKIKKEDGLKYYRRKCKKCSKYFFSTMKGSRVCPNCDKIRRSIPKFMDNGDF